MPVLSSPSTWRTHPYRSYGYAYIWRPAVVFQARVNMPTAVYPLTSITFDGVTAGAYTDIEAGMTLLIGSSAGASDLGRQRVRAAATSTTIPIGRSSPGNRPGEVTASDNAYITVLDLREVWAKIPYIDQTGVSLKDQVSFAANIAQPPIANGGPAVIGFVDDDDELTVNFTGALSQVVDASGGSLTYSWNFRDGTAPATNTQTVNGVTFPPGQRYVSLTVSDGTRSHTTHIPVVALTRTGTYAPLPVRVATRVLRPEGQSISFEVRVPELNPDDYPYGSLVLYFEEEWYGNTQTSLAGTSGRQHLKFAGWLDNETASIQASAQGMDYVVTVNALDVAGRLSKLPGFGQRIQRSASPTSWQEMANANIDRYLHHLLHWHSTSLEVAPFQWSGAGANYPFKDLGSDGANLYQQVDDRARAIAGRLTCNSRGELRVRLDPQRLPVGDRTTVTIAELDERDWSSIGYELRPHPEVHWLRGSALVASATTVQPVFCISPGSTPGQGEGENDTGEQLVLSQYGLNVRNGHDYARLNMMLKSLDILLAHGGDGGFEPADMEWLELGIPLAFAGPREVTYPADARWLITENQIAYDHDGRTNISRLKLEPEVQGLEAETVIPKTSGQVQSNFNWTPIGSPYTNFPIDPSIVYPSIPFTPTLPVINPVMPYEPDISGNVVLVATDENEVIVVLNYKQAVQNDVDWQYRIITPELDAGEVIQQVIPSGFGTDAYCLVTDGTNSRVYYTNDFSVVSPVWIGGAAVEGVFTQIKTTWVPGEVYILGATLAEEEEGDWDITLDFTQSSYGFSVGTHPQIAGATNAGRWVAGQGWQLRAQNYRTFLFITSPTFSPITLVRGDTILYYNNTDAVTLGGSNYSDAKIQVTRSNSTTDLSGSFTPTPLATGTGLQALGTGLTNAADVVDFSIAVRQYPGSVENGWAPTYITGIRISGTGPNPFATSGFGTRFSDDFGDTFAALEDVGDTPLNFGGLDTSKVGSQVIATAADQPARASDGGAYTAYGDPRPAGALVIPRYQVGSTTLGNDGSTPDFVLFGEAEDGGETMWYWDGSAYTAITPTEGSDNGLAVSPHCLVMPWRSGQRLALVGNFGGTRRLKTSTNSGSTWVDRTAISSDCHYIRMRKSDKQVRELYIANGTLAVYSPNFGSNLYSKTLPVDGKIVSLEVFG